jgi:anti-anti-sigma factor
MSSSSIKALKPRHWRLSGPLTLDRVAALAAEGKRLAAAAEKAAPRSGSADVLVDLAAVTKGSSAGVALLLELQQQVGQAGGQLRWCNVPEALSRIAEFSNVDGLLSLGSNPSSASDLTHPPTRP